MFMSDEAVQPPDSQMQPVGTRRNVALRNLFLDPNNYRFIDQPDYVRVPDDKVMDADVQRRTTNFLLGRNNEEVSDLVASFKKSGWLPVDQIQVRQIGQGKYLVVEGNRRVAALKHMERRFQEGGVDLGAFDFSFFSTVPVVLYENADEAHHLIVMALGHISGKKRWPLVNQARLVQSLIKDHNWSEQDVCDAVGISKKELRSTLKTLELCEKYQASDYGDQFTPEKFNIFREIVRNRDIKDWLGVANDFSLPESLQRLDRLFSWISRSEETSAEEEDGSINSDPIINTGADVRELGRIIHDENALKTLDETRRLSEATLLSDVLVTDRIESGLANINQNLNVLFNHSVKLQEKHMVMAEDALKKLRGLLTARDRQPAMLSERLERRSINQVRRGHFHSLSLVDYKRLRSLNIAGLKRINLFVGPNNTGKTSLLEAVSILANQNDVDELLRMICRRGKVADDPPPTWVKDQIQTKLEVVGCFDDVPVNLARVKIRNEMDGEELEDKTFYVTSIEVDAEYAGKRHSAITHLFERRDRITRLESVQVLCPVVFSSPFTQHDTETMVELFNRSVDAKTKDKIIEFIKKELDPGFKDVDAAPAYGSRNFTRFRVNHDGFQSACDLAQFGEGVQRIFQIGLLFAYAQDGIVLIDEFENAIHYSLLRPFTRLVQQLAVEFNAQVFLTSHSKECVDAFMTNGNSIEDVSAYALRVEHNNVRGYHYPAERLKHMLDFVDIDLRGSMLNQGI
jgi:predicted ATPase